MGLVAWTMYLILHSPTAFVWREGLHLDSAPGTSCEAHSTNQAFMSMSSHFLLPNLASAHLTGEDTEAESRYRLSPGHMTKKLSVFVLPICLWAYSPAQLMDRKAFVATISQSVMYVVGA